MAEQLIFDLPIRAAKGREDFIVSDCNRAAVDLIDAWPDWPGMAVCLVGGAGSGKSHLASVWADRSNAVQLKGANLTQDELASLLADDPPASVVVDDIDDLADEEALFHLFNHIKEGAGHLLLAAKAAPARLPIGLADLASRLATAHVVALEEPDDALLLGLFAKLFQDRQMRVGGEIVQYLVSRTERSFAAVCDLVAELDARSLKDRRRITIPLAREILEGDEAGPDE